MTLKPMAALMAMGTLVLTGCAKDKETEPLAPPPVPGKKVYFLLDKVEYKDSKKTAYFDYNPDSTVKQILHESEISSAEVNYTYTNKKLIRVEVPGSVYVTNFGYTNGVMSHLEGSQNAGGGHRLEYDYNTNNSLKTMRHYKINEAGQQLLFTSTYQYSADNLLEKVTTVAAGATLTWTLENYSDSCSIEPNLFITGNGLDEMYAIYNYPMLSNLPKLPGKITLTRKNGNNAPFVEKIYENACTITHKKLEKMKLRVTYPGSTPIVSNEEVVLHYK